VVCSSISLSFTHLLVLLISLQHLSLYFGYRKLSLYPEGNGTGVDTYLSIFLRLDDDLESLPPNRKLYAKYKLRIRDQVHGNHLEKTGMFS
jgi:hypothetical protein